MNNQTILELREQDAFATNYDVASWENTLSQEVTLYENDSLSLKGAFIDSVSQNSGRIVVDPDDPSAPKGSDLATKATIGITFTQYFTDWGSSKGGADPLVDREYLPNNQKYQSGRNYVLCDKISAGGATITEISALIFLNDVNKAVTNPLTSNIVDPVKFFFHYLNPSGKETKLEFNLDETLLKKHSDYSGVGQTGTLQDFTIDQQLLDIPGIIKGGHISFPILAIKNGMGVGTNTTIVPDSTVSANVLDKRGKIVSTFTGDKFMRFEFMTFQSSTLEDVQNTDGDIFQPRLLDFTFQIEARDYSPDELARELSKNFTKTEPERYIEDEFALVDNPLLTTSRSLQVIGDAVVNAVPGHLTPVPAGNANTPPSFCRDDGLAIANFATDCDNYIVGTNQFAVEFNENIGAEGIFQITQIHTPIIDKDSNTIVKGIDLGVKAEAGGKRVKFLANKNGGVLLTDVRPRNLWEKKMNFDTTKLLTNFKMSPSQSFGGLTNIRTCSFNVVDGSNATGALKSIDDTINKNVSFDLVNPFTAVGIDVITPFLMEINASQSLGGDDPLDSGYYLIEMTSTFYTEKISGQDKKSNIMGIVSRFYQQNSFTSSIDGEGTFTYVHKGEPISISKIGCRILNAQHQLAPNLKNNNTVFLQVNRA